jgi:NitT/TauT family transport system permease protein
VSQRVRATQAAPAVTAPRQRRRLGFLRTYLTPKQAIPRRARLLLGVGSFVVILLVWQTAAMIIDNPLFAPAPTLVWTAWLDMLQNQHFLSDIGWSAFRIIGGFLIAAVMAVPLGLLMGSFEVVRAFF